MQMLLCAATEFEIAPAISLIRREQIQDVEVLITGVGLLACSYSLMKYISRKRPDFILQAGVAGTFNFALPLTKVVLVESEAVGDLGVEEKSGFHSLFDLGLLDAQEGPWKNGKLHNDLSHFKALGLTVVDGVSVNEISTRPETIERFRAMGASVESMEGAALHYIALREGIRFLQMRSLSNFAGERDKSKWMMRPAIESLNTELERLLIKFLKS